ncbi:MAG TPA: hypothetical protein VFO10_03110 [Oligoflexus sp.]|uniref:hypothetical protein n=1 Tax=Oligoflexus sp. TaxID=1971216 RepID=UPI002D810631|nr:hypothetical protein [Oligoflexus sp.]HET9236213.1 hypothetical protein [Oligoflexus sp.]
MNQDEIDAFEKINGQLESVYVEVSSLSKKNPNDAVSKFKLGFVNALLIAANDVLGDDYRPAEDFSVFDVDSLPTTSDVAFVCGQYLSCLEKLRSDNIESEFGEWYWVINKRRSESFTKPPEKLKKR